VISYKANNIKNNANMYEIEQVFRKFHIISNKKSSSFTEHDKKEMYWSTKSRAKTRNISFNININDFDIPDFCPVLDIPLFL